MDGWTKSLFTFHNNTFGKNNVGSFGLISYQLLLSIIEVHAI